MDTILLWLSGLRRLNMNQYGLMQRILSLLCILGVCGACLLFCMCEGVPQYVLFSILCGMFVLFFAATVRYALSKENQISGQYRKSLSGWRLPLFDFMKIGTPVLILASLIVSFTLYLL